MEVAMEISGKRQIFYIFSKTFSQIFSEFFQNPSKTSRLISLSQHYISDRFK